MGHKQIPQDWEFDDYMMFSDWEDGADDDVIFFDGVDGVDEDGTDEDKHDCTRGCEEHDFSGRGSDEQESGDDSN